MKIALFLVCLHLFQFSVAQQNPRDSFIYSHAVEIVEVEHGFTTGEERVGYYEGRELAQNYEGLALMTLGDPGHVSVCKYYSYEYWGVKLMPIGDIVFSEMEGKVIGFNEIMLPRIRAQLGEKYDSLGKLPSHVQNLDDSILDNLPPAIVKEAVGTDSVLVQLNTQKLRFLYSEETTVQAEPNANKIYRLEELEQGIVFPKMRANFVLLTLKIGDFEGIENWCGSRIWRLPIKVKQQ